MVDDLEQPMVGVVLGGCQLEADIFTPFYSEDGHITLILDRNHANFQTAALSPKRSTASTARASTIRKMARRRGEEDLCHARDAANIRVRIPEVYRNDPVGFASDVLDIKLYEHEPESRVVINPRAGSIVISGDVEIGTSSCRTRTSSVEAVGDGPRVQPRSTSINRTIRSCKQLVDQLNSLKVPTLDMIEIIRGIERNGKLHGRLIIE